MSSYADVRSRDEEQLHLIAERFRNHPQVHIIDHPLIAHKLTHMRSADTSTKTFRHLLREISLLMGYEITRAFPTTLKRINTPVKSGVQFPVIEGKKVAIVPILRAGTGMADGLLELMPSARIGHIGLYRDPVTKSPVEYLVKLPDVRDRMFILTDPMLATGNSAVHAINVLKSRGVDANSIVLMTLVGAPEGLRNVFARHPDVQVYLAALDDCLDERAYIVPGLGDAGDRLFGTR